MSSLNKNLKLIHVFSIASGAMISSGIFILPGIAFQMSGPSLFLAYMIAGLIAMIGALSIIELATAMPKAGGDYFFIGRTFGPLAGTVTGTLSWLALSLKTAFAIFGLSEILFLITGIPAGILALALCALFVIINIIGVQETVFLEVLLVSGLLLIMVLFITAGIPSVSRKAFQPLFEGGFNKTLSTAAFVFVSFGGLLQVATIAEEVKNPQKNIQRGTLLSILVVTALYVGIIFVTTGILPAEQFSGSMTPVADAAALIIGTPGFIIISVAAALAFITTSIAGLLSASRYPLALSRDGLLPGWISKVSPRSGAPVPAILLTGLIIALALQLDLDVLVKSASAVIMITYIMSNIAVIVLRESGLSNYKPLYKAPLYPWLQIITILIYLFLLADMGWTALETALAFTAGSVLIYIFYGRKRATHDFALIHLLKKVVDGKWQEEGLEHELMDIVHHRDMGSLVESVFSGMKIIDLDAGITSDELFRIIADDAGKAGFDADNVLKGLHEREQSFSTAITDFTAIPHMVLNSESAGFGLFIYRCREGIRFGEEKKQIRSVFACLGAEKDRSLHLHTLAGLAGIISREDFREKWMDAESPSNLKEWLNRQLKKR